MTLSMDNVYDNNRVQLQMEIQQMLLKTNELVS